MFFRWNANPNTKIGAKMPRRSSTNIYCDVLTEYSIDNNSLIIDNSNKVLVQFRIKNSTFYLYIDGGFQMKKLMLGNQAVARGAYEAGVKVATAYPGTPSTEITENIAKYDKVYSEWSPNEKVALEVAIGSSIAGGRSICAMKHVGLNVAADPLFTVSYTGVNAGLVIMVADDPGMHSSQNEQDSRLYAKASKVPMLEPADSQECKDFVKAAFDISEKFDTPVIVRLTTRISHSQSI